MANEPKPPVVTKDDPEKSEKVAFLTDKQFMEWLEVWKERELPPRVAPDAEIVTFDVGGNRVTLPDWLKDVVKDKNDPRYRTLVNLIDLARAYSPSSYRLNAPPEQPAVVNQPNRVNKN